MIVRKEESTDIKAITEVTIAAFKKHPISNHTEQFIINALRAAANALAISLVAEADGRAVGHIAFSTCKSLGRRNRLVRPWSNFYIAGLSETGHR